MMITDVSLLLQAVTAPMSVLNFIALEAYKKYILVSLIHNGQVCSIHSASQIDSDFDWWSYLYITYITDGRHDVGALVAYAFCLAS